MSYVIPDRAAARRENGSTPPGPAVASQQCSGLWYADLRHGFSRTLTVQAGADAQRDSGGPSMRPYGAVSYLPAPGWTTGVQARRDSYVARFGAELHRRARERRRRRRDSIMPGEGGVAITSRPRRDVVRADHAADQGRASAAHRARVHAVVAPRGAAARWPVAVGLSSLLSRSAWACWSSGCSRIRSRSRRGAAQGPALVRVAPTIALGGGIFRRLAYPVVRLEAGMQRRRAGAVGGRPVACSRARLRERGGAARARTGRHAAHRSAARTRWASDA